MALFDKLDDILDKTDLDDKLMDKIDLDGKLLKKLGLDDLDDKVVEKIKKLIDKVDFDKINFKDIAKKVDLDEGIVKKIVTALKK